MRSHTVGKMVHLFTLCCLLSTSLLFISISSQHLFCGLISLTPFLVDYPPSFLSYYEQLQLLPTFWIFSLPLHLPPVATQEVVDSVSEYLLIEHTAYRYIITTVTSLRLGSLNQSKLVILFLSRMP